MKNVMQLKAIIKNIAKEKNISAALVLQNYMLERFLERVSLSKYHDNYIIKGGFLIASMVCMHFAIRMPHAQSKEEFRRKFSRSFWDIPLCRPLWTDMYR